MRRATEQSDAAVEALELNALHGALIVINVRLAADRNCSADSRRRCTIPTAAPSDTDWRSQWAGERW